MMCQKTPQTLPFFSKNGAHYRLIALDPIRATYLPIGELRPAPIELLRPRKGKVAR